MQNLSVLIENETLTLLIVKVVIGGIVIMKRLFFLQEIMYVTKQYQLFYCYNKAEFFFRIVINEQGFKYLIQIYLWINLTIR